MDTQRHKLNLRYGIPNRLNDIARKYFNKYRGFDSYLLIEQEKSKDS